MKCLWQSLGMTETEEIMKQKISVLSMILGSLFVLASIGGVIVAWHYGLNVQIFDSYPVQIIRAQLEMLIYIATSFFSLFLGVFLIFIGKNIKDKETIS